MGDTPDFKVKWRSRNVTTYDVPGKTYDDVYKYFKQKKDDWARFDYNHSFYMDKNSDKTKPPTGVGVHASWTIKLPVWSNANSLNDKAKTAWHAMRAAAKKHAEKHTDIFEDEIEKLSNAVGKEKDFKKWNALYIRFAADLKKLQDGYDSSTGHGQKEGVVLPPPDKVKG